MADGSVFVATSGGSGDGGGGVITQLRPVPYRHQAAELLAQGEHEEALALCSLIAASEVCVGRGRVPARTVVQRWVLHARVLPCNSPPPPLTLTHHFPPTR